FHQHGGNKTTLHAPSGAHGGTYDVHDVRPCPLPETWRPRLHASRAAGGHGVLRPPAGFRAPRYFAQVGKSRVKAARAQIDALDKALEQYRLDVGRLPTSEEGLTALQVAPQGVTNWEGPYLKKDVPLDPWGHPYIYLQPGTHQNDFDLISYGRDAQQGGTGEDADLTNY